MALPAFNRVIGEIGDFFLPQVCLFCRSPGIRKGHVPLCPGCLEGFIPVTEPFCPCCGLPYPGETGTHICASCQQAPPPYTWARSLILYRGRGWEFIHHLKFNGDLSTLSVLRYLLLERMEKETRYLMGEFALDLIVPVPLHPRGLRERGYNQALLIALCLSEVLHLPVDRTHLVKARETLPQIGLTKSERERNIQGAFETRNPDRFKGKRVLLVDDVYTTGATVKICTRTLLRAGAHSVYVWTLARTAMT
ncbi:MAG: ComF family protein [Deltaproteobacteria bacterium]|nr:MAG: ComF family protein [Deltaproteobacteria bacterium]